MPSDPSAGSLPVHDLDPSPDDRPVVALCKLILGQALDVGATRIRLASTSPTPLPLLDTSIEFFVADSWKPVMGLPILAYAPLIDRLKMMANLDNTKQPSQPGAMVVRFKGRAASAHVAVTLVATGREDATVDFANGAGV